MTKDTKAPAKKTAAKRVAKKETAPKKKVANPAPSVATPAKDIIRKRFSGVVTSDKMDKTITVKVDRVVLHSKYRKRYTVSRKYKVHDEKESFSIGDVVTFVECRPLSKDKKWRVLYNGAKK